jgi:hypothetical protein
VFSGSSLSLLLELPEDGELRIDLKGDLAAILNIANNKKPPGVDSGGHHEVQVKLVAGARNRLNLLIFATNLPKLR